jgi:hypothetical protein
VSKAAGRLSDAIIELDRALHIYIAEEEQKHGVPRAVSAESALASMSPALVTLLLDHMPTLAMPWRVTDMRDGEPTRLVRDGYRDVIASVRRVSQGKRGCPRWTAFVGNEVISPPPIDDLGNAMPIDWSTCEEAQAACDANLRESGITIVETPS